MHHSQPLIWQQLEERKIELEEMKAGLETLGRLATDNKEYNNKLLDIKLEELDIRKDATDSDAAKREKCRIEIKKNRIRRLRQGIY